MDKFKPKRLNLQGVEFLSREQLKKVVGGSLMLPTTTTTGCPTGTSKCYCDTKYEGCMTILECDDACNCCP